MQGYTRNLPPDPKGLTPRMVEYDWFGKAYGWSPDVVDNLTMDQMFWLHVINEARDTATEKLASLQERQQ